MLVGQYTDLPEKLISESIVNAREFLTVLTLQGDLNGLWGEMQPTSPGTNSRPWPNRMVRAEDDENRPWPNDHRACSGETSIQVPLVGITGAREAQEAVLDPLNVINIRVTISRPAQHLTA